jgi:hypothetical protein
MEHLKHIAGLSGVPVLFCGEDVMMDGKVLCTGKIRGVVLPGMRVRRRIVTSSVGSHISKFKNKRELISVLRDIVMSMLNMLFICVLLNSPFIQRLRNLLTKKILSIVTLVTATSFYMIPLPMALPVGIKVLPRISVKGC